MKVTGIIAILSVGSTAAFSVSNQQQSISKHVQKISSAAATLATALTISANVATAAPAPTDMNTNMNMDQGSSILLSSRGDSTDPFSLPSYDDSIKKGVIEVDLDSVNSKILEDAKAKRDDKNVNKEANARSIELRKEEEEENKRMERMREFAKRERLEAIEREKAETKANRWNTF